MTKLKFEGSSEGLSDNQYKFIEDVLEKRGYRNKKVLIEPVGVAGDGYMASIKRITAEGGEKPFKIIAKVAPKLKNLRDLFNTHSLFNNEHTIYTEVIPQFKKMLEEANIPKSYTIRFPECYGSCNEELEELILLEDLKELDCVMLDRFKPLSEECLRSVLKNLAIFHSLSFVLKHKNPEMFNLFRRKLFHCWVDKSGNEETNNSFKLIEDHILNLLSDNEERCKVIKGIIINFANNLSKLAKEETECKQTVIQHGDAWTNNIMFRFEGKTLLESIMIDYQIAFETNPTSDILFLIFNCTHHQTRLKKFNEWIDYYHSELDGALSKFGLNVDDNYPKDKLDADLKRYGKAICGLSCFSSYVNTLNLEDAAKITESLDQNVEIGNILETGNSEKFKAKVEGIVDTCLKFGLI